MELSSATAAKRGALASEATASAAPAAHRGYARRAEEVPIKQMWRLAAVRGKRLVLSGEASAGCSMGQGRLPCCK